MNLGAERWSGGPIIKSDLPNSIRPKHCYSLLLVIQLCIVHKYSKIWVLFSYLKFKSLFSEFINLFWNGVCAGVFYQYHNGPTSLFWPLEYVFPKVATDSVFLFICLRGSTLSVRFSQHTVIPEALPPPTGVAVHHCCSSIYCTYVSKVLIWR